MKPASPTLAALINSASFYTADLYAFTLVSGPVVRLATGDFDAIDNSANVYSCGSAGSGYPKIDLKQSKVQGKWAAGLDSDKWQVFILPDVQDQVSGAFTYPDVVGSIPWLTACRAGLFDGAAVTVARAYYSSPPAPPYTASSRTCVGSLVVFSGIVGQVDTGPTISVFSLNDYKQLLTQQMPRNLYQSSCRHQLFDSRCTLNAATYAHSATALAGSSRANVVASPAAPGGSGSYQLGLMQCTSGANSGFYRTIASWDGVDNFQPQYPWPFAVAPGDGFTFWPGCDKSLGAGGCGGFANVANFGGEPYIPVPEVQIG
jgi:uncharacterized phage protein (TIGR02218 family)